MNKEDLVVFFHHPKAGGTSVRSWLEENLGPGLHLNKYLQLPKSEQDEIRWVSGHLWWGCQKQIHGRNVIPITVLRHPLERLMSIYRFNKHPRDQLRNHKCATVIREERMTLDEFLLTGAQMMFRCNEQTERMAGKDCPLDERLSYAMAHLHSCRVVGVHEDMEPIFRQRCAEVLGLGDTTRMLRLNQSMDADEPYPSLLTAKLMQRLCAPDLSLWELALEVGRKTTE